MNELLYSEVPMPKHATNNAVLFALVAERLSVYFEHHAWLTVAQGATLAAEWLARAKRKLPLNQRKHLSELSDQLARQVAGSVSREAGLHISHEMMEALDERYSSEIAQRLRDECDRLLITTSFPDHELTP